MARFLLIWQDASSTSPVHDKALSLLARVCGGLFTDVWQQILLTYCLCVCMWLHGKPLAGVSPTGYGAVRHRSLKGQDTVDVGDCGRN
jgi:hypothetical protein